MTGVSGMAAAIRAATESETFDLHGQNKTTISKTIHDAFAEPISLPANHMIRITFVTGAGKLERQKYDEGAAKAVTATLRELGFEEDRGASCVVECAGSFKSQHDTGKNLKTVVVFPKVEVAALEEDMDNLAVTTKSLLPEKSPENMIAMSSTNVFERMVASKCPSWSQKKGCVAALESLKAMLKELDDKLMSGTPLEDSEQDFYDSVTLSSLDEKEAFVKKEMHAQVDNGKLTKQELDTLLDQVTERLATLDKEIADSAEKPKKLEKLKAMKEKATQRKELLAKTTAQPPHKLRHEAEIMKLYKEMAPLTELEKGAKGRLLTVKETQTLARKTEIMEEIEELEASSRGWFEDDDAFQLRVDACRAAGLKRKAPAKKSAKSSAASSFKLPSTTNWVTPGAQKKGAWGKPSAAKKKAAPKGGSVFSAMMMDSDSD